MIPLNQEWDCIEIKMQHDDIIDFQCSYSQWATLIVSTNSRTSTSKGVQIVASKQELYQRLYTETYPNLPIYEKAGSVITASTTWCISKKA